MQKLFKIALESQEIFVACIWGIIRIGAVKMVGMLLQIQLFFMQNYNKVLFVLVALSAVALLYLEWKSKKIINEEMNVEEIKALTGKAEFLRTVFIVAVAFLGLVTKNYAQAFILLVAEILVLKINTIRLRKELQKEKDMTEAKEKMFVFEVKHIAKILRGEL
ncbi:MAG: hypothetical protein RSD13_02885 [Clostridium sp.]